jgi:putative ubiquitin-RnfH superfamily antitoxin RatB of RatAB toxin-antitoxin module
MISADRLNERMAKQITVEVVLALPDRQIVRRVTLPDGATASQALEASGLRRDWPALVDPLRLGVFSRQVTPEQRISEGDRIEVYRPLTLDPKDARRRRARTPG